MATVTGYTAAYMDSQMDENIVDGSIVGDHLILEKRDGSTVDAGDVRGPAGTDGVDAAPGSVTVVGDTTIVRTSNGRGKVATPTETDDATTKAYVDAINTALDSRVDTLEATDVTYDGRLDALEAADVSLDSRLDAIEAIFPIRKMAGHVMTTDGSLSASEVNICSITIPNPINGARYRCYFQGNFISNGSLESRTRLKHGIGAVTGGTQIAEACLNHDATTRAMSCSLMTEFTFTGTTGQSSYNVVVTHAPLSGQSRVSAASTRPATLQVDRVA